MHSFQKINGTSMNGENSEESYRECNLGFTGDTLRVNEIVKEEWVIEKQRIKP